MHSQIFSKKKLSGAQELTNILLSLGFFTAIGFYITVQEDYYN